MTFEKMQYSANVSERINHDRRRLLGTAILTIAAAALLFATAIGMAFVVAACFYLAIRLF